MKKKFEFINIGLTIINKDFFDLLKKSGLLEDIKDFDSLKKNFLKVFSHRKRYRIIKGFQIDGLKLFVKKYEKHLEESEKEWKNISLLWKKGFPTSIPVFFYKNSSIGLIGTEAISGQLCIDIIKKNPEKTEEIIKEIAKFLGNFHKAGLFHQDCYLNHFYWDEENKMLSVLDVSRVVENPLFPLKYQIKDLAQLAFSFETYLEKEAPFLWNYFWKNYVNYYGVKNEKILKFLVDIKRWLIRKRTIRKLLKGEEL